VPPSHRSGVLLIAQLTGRILRKEPQELVLDVAGVGYRVTIPLSTFYRLDEPGAEVTVLIHTHVREDTFALFGFVTASEQALFERLISVAGVGPRLAIGILSGIEAPDLVSALVHLGYSRPEAERGVEKALEQGADGRFEDLLRRTLRILSGR